MSRSAKPEAENKKVKQDEAPELFSIVLATRPLSRALVSVPCLSITLQYLSPG